MKHTSGSSQSGVAVMKVKTALLLLGLTLLEGVCPLQPQELNVQAGEMVVLQCPHYIGHNPDNDTQLVWTSYTVKEKYVASDISSAEQRQMLIHGRSLVILIASLNHQGNYSCSLRKASSQFWFRLTVNTAQSTENEERPKYSKTCYTQEPCTLNCPDVNTPDANTLTTAGIVWHKEGELLPKEGYFPSVGGKDHGVYTCTRLYLYHGQIYNMSFAVVLDIKPKRISGHPVILSPQNNIVFYVDLGSTVVIDCEAVVYSHFDEVFWLIGSSFVETNNSFPVFYNYTWEKHDEELKVTASLVFKKVSEEDLSRSYICKLESASDPSSFVNITLAQKAHPFSLSVALGIVGILLMILVLIVIVVCMKFKLGITLFLRDTLGCHNSISDGKSYDAFLVYYKSHTDAGLNEDSRQCLESVLEDRFGYSLCHYHNDVLPKRAELKAVLSCMEQSHTVVLVPSSDSGVGTDVLNDIYATLVEWKIRLVLIKTETTVVPMSGSLPEALQLLGEAGDCVTWKGTSSMTSSSSFFKQLRDHLPAPQNATKIALLPLVQDNNC